MAFTATLNVGNLSGVLLENFSYSLNRSVYDDGKPSSGIRGGTITLTIQSSKDTSLFDWMCSPVKRQGGSIEIKETGQDAAARTLNFEDAYLVGYEENFDRWADQSMTETFVISAKKIEMNGNYHENEWTDM